MIPSNKKVATLHDQIASSSSNGSKEPSNMSDLPFEIIKSVIKNISDGIDSKGKPIPARLTRNRLALTSRAFLEFVADDVVRLFKPHIGTGKRSICVIATKQTPEEENLFAEALMYANSKIVPQEKVEWVVKALDEFLIRPSKPNPDWYDEYEQQRKRLSFLVDNLHIFSSEIYCRISEYVKSKGDYLVNLKYPITDIAQYHPRNIQKCENILSISFMKPTHEIIINTLYSRWSAHIIRKYVPNLKKETMDATAETVLKNKKYCKEEKKVSHAYNQALGYLAYNIDLYNQSIREKVRNEFYEALSEFTRSRISQKPRPKKCLDALNFHAMCQAIERLPIEEKESWRFITNYKKIYKPWPRAFSE